METAPTDPIPNLCTPLFLNTFHKKGEIRMTVLVLIFGLLLAVALGSLRAIFIAALMLVCIVFPAVLTVVVPAIAGGIFYLFWHWVR